MKGRRQGRDILLGLFSKGNVKKGEEPLTLAPNSVEPRNMTSSRQDSQLYITSSPFGVMFISQLQLDNRELRRCKPLREKTGQLSGQHWSKATNPKTI